MPNELPSIDTIKDYLKRIASLGEKIGAIADVDKDLVDKLSELAYTMFCYHKQRKKTFTICKNRRLRNIRIQEDADGFSESDTLIVADFIRQNILTAFAELVSVSYLPASTKDNQSQLFTADVYSRYSGEKHNVFFANRNDQVYVFDNELTEIKLQDFISNYFSASSSIMPEVEAVCKIASSQNTFSKKQQDILSKIEEFNDAVTKTHDFISGAITFLDFLAWKGLWQSQDAQSSLKEVADLIESFRGELAKLSREYFARAKDIPLSSLISISDTIAVFTPKTSDAEICDLIELHAKFSRYVLEKCCESQYPIRGATTYGEYSVMKNIMIGPGIDECASWHETGNWIGVHLAPMAQIYWDDHEKGTTTICQYKVPLKSGLEANYCVRWHISKEAFHRLVCKNRALLPGISGKYINTQKFLQELEKEEVTDGQK